MNRSCNHQRKCTVAHSCTPCMPQQWCYAGSMHVLSLQMHMVLTAHNQRWWSSSVAAAAQHTCVAAFGFQQLVRGATSSHEGSPGHLRCLPTAEEHVRQRQEALEELLQWHAQQQQYQQQLHGSGVFQGVM